MNKVTGIMDRILLKMYKQDEAIKEPNLFFGITWHKKRQFCSKKLGWSERML
jgi:hypothetical protein